MKVSTIGGRVVAEAESVADVKALLAYTSTSKPVKKPYKKPCELCGKRVKYIQAHLKTMHSRMRLPGADSNTPA